LRRYKLPGINKIMAELIESGCETLRSEIHKIINSVWNMEEFPQQWNKYTTLPIYKNW